MGIPEELQENLQGPVGPSAAGGRCQDLSASSETDVDECVCVLALLTFSIWSFLSNGAACLPTRRLQFQSPEQPGQADVHLHNLKVLEVLEVLEFVKVLECLKFLKILAVLEVLLVLKVLEVLEFLKVLKVLEGL